MVKGLADVLDRAVNKSTLSRAEADPIQDQLSEIQTMKGIRDTSVLARGHDLIRSADFMHQAGGTYDHCTTAQPLKMVSGVRSAGYTVNTERMMIVTLKRFFIWLDEEMGARLDEKKIRKIKVPAMNYDAKHWEDLITKDRYEQLIGACQNSRGRAIIALLYDGSHWPIEVVNLKWRTW